MQRRALPQRRHCETFNLDFRGAPFEVSVGFYDRAGTEPGEIFISGPKSGADFEGVCRDSAILLSLAIQHGVPLDVIRGAVTRNEDNSPATIVGAIVDRLA